MNQNFQKISKNDKNVVKTLSQPNTFYYSTKQPNIA